ncbi:MAG TPA: hypothetical protein VN764_12940 [Polyangiaceae bacterium]|nr:hypothetical protein [Polyangiaceae bacterium]
MPAMTPTVEAISVIASTLAPEAAKALLTLCKQAKKSPNPEEFLRRKAKAEASHLGAQEIAKQALKKTKKKAEK